MKHYSIFCIALSLTGNSSILYGSFSPAPKNTINFSGTLMDRQGYTMIGNHLRFARTKDEQGKVKQIGMYAKPKDTATFEAKEKEYILNIEPATQLREYFMDFDEIKSFEVPEPTMVWTYQQPGKNYKINYIEIIVQEKNGINDQSMLVELGRNDTKNPLKIFFSELSPAAHDKKEKDGTFCNGMGKNELNESGIPLQALKKVIITGYCHEVPQDTTTKK